MEINEKMFPPLIGDKVTVEIPDGLPKLMMDVSLEVLRNPPSGGEKELFSFIADYLERRVAERDESSGDVMDKVTNITKTDEEKYLDELKQQYADEQLDKLAATIQKKWKKYKEYNHGDSAAKDIRTDDHENPTDKTLQYYGISSNTANRAAARIQQAWRKSRQFTSAERYKSEDMEELDFEYDYPDDMECVNVSKKGQRDYVPPNPDFINDSFKNPSATDVFDELMDISEGE